MNEIKLMKRFLASVKMGNKIIKNIESKTSSLEIRKLWVDILNSFAVHENNIIEVMENLGVNTEVDLSMMQKMAICMQKMKLKGNDDVELLFFGIEGLEMGMVGTLKFIHVNEFINEDFISEAISIYDEYERSFNRVIKKAKEYLNLDYRRTKKNDN